MEEMCIVCNLRSGERWEEMYIVCILGSGERWEDMCIVCNLRSGERWKRCALCVTCVQVRDGRDVHCV